jgi:class 3 adenylate cyclase
LFSDVAGFTGLGDRLDPEVTRQVMARYFDVMRRALERHGGTVEKFIGDAVMAVFGIPKVHEDDAIRACRAAVEMREEFDLLNKELERDWGVTLASRTGLNTGEVVAGDPSGQALVTGDAVNMGARLEQAAPTGAVLIGETTYRAARDAVEVEPFESIAAKGKVQPVAAYLLRSVIPGVATRSKLGSPLVGRERELRELEGAFERAVAERTCVLVTIVGTPGVGKSRLSHEFTGSVADRATVVRGRCLPYGEGITFWPIVEVVRQAARISEGDSTEGARSRIETLLRDGEERAVIGDRVAAAVGLGGATGEIPETFWAIRKLFEALADDRPVVMVFDDIHWAEPTFLDLVEYLEGRTRSSPLLLLCVARPDLLDARPGWASAATRPLTIALDPLTDRQSDSLIQNLLGSSAVSEELRERVMEAAEGNPLFVEEMLSMLIDEHRLRREGDRWVAVGGLSTMATPPSIQSLLAARIERLPEDERLILQCASVVGKVFWWDAVTDLSGPDRRTRIESQLQSLVRKGMIRPEETTFVGHDAFVFHHILIRDAAYRSLPRATRARLHEGFAEWLERIVGDQVEGYEEILGYHLEQATRQQLVSTGEQHRELAARASKFLASAGDRALDRGDDKAALNLLSRAAELSPLDRPEALAIRLSLAQALHSAGEFQHAQEVLTELADRARAAGDQRLEWRAKIHQGQIVASTSDVSFDEISATADRAIEIFSELDDDRGLFWSWGLLGWMHFNAGRAHDAMKAASKATAHARSAGELADGLLDGLVYAVQGPTPVEEALGLCRDVRRRIEGYPAHKAGLLEKKAVLEAMNSNIEGARAAIGLARSTWQELGNATAMAAFADWASPVEWYAGDLGSAERERRLGHEAYRKMGAVGYQATQAALLAQLLVELGRDDEALELTHESEAFAVDYDITAQVPWRVARGRILARRGVREEAERVAREGVAIAERTDWLNLQGDALMGLADVLRLARAPDEAAGAARAAVERYEQKGNLVSGARTRALLQRLASKQA